MGILEGSSLKPNDAVVLVWESPCGVFWVNVDAASAGDLHNAAKSGARDPGEDIPATAWPGSDLLLLGPDHCRPQMSKRTFLRLSSSTGGCMNCHRHGCGTGSGSAVLLGGL